MKFKIILLVFTFVFCLLSTCTRKPTEPEISDFEGESRPVGPLRTVNSKIKTETIYRLNTNEILEKTNYEYYNEGLLKTKTRSLADLAIYTTTNYYYDNLSNLIKEIIFEGSLYADTVLYRYDSSNKLIQKETIHSTPNFVLRDTVFYKYDIKGNLIETTRKDPYEEYAKIYMEKYEYSNGLLMKTYFYYGGDLIKSIEHKYFNEIMTEKLVYTPAGLLEHRYVYYYHDGLLKNVKGYFANEKDVSDQKIYEYNNQYELIIQKVYVPMYSSYVNHEIHYEYY